MFKNIIVLFGALFTLLMAGPTFASDYDAEFLDELAYEYDMGYETAARGCVAIKWKHNGKNFGTFTGRNCMEQCWHSVRTDRKAHKYTCRCESGSCMRNGGGRDDYVDCQDLRRRKRRIERKIRNYCY